MKNTWIAAVVFVLGITVPGILRAETAPADAKAAEIAKLKTDLKAAQQTKITEKGELTKLREKQRAEREAKRAELKTAREARKTALAQKREALKKAKGEWKSSQVKKKLRS